MTTSDELHAEGVLDGLAAFHAGAVRAPIADAKAKQKADANCEHIASYLTGWIEGWDRANLMKQMMTF